MNAMNAMKVMTPPPRQGKEPIAIHNTVHDALRFQMPAGACDCHTHVFGPAERYPFAANRHYTPGDASVQELLTLQRHLGLQRVVIVHPSPYGSDNACTLDALRELGERARGVAVIDEKTSDAQLNDMHEAGVRGVRLNLETGGVNDPVYAARQLEWAAARVAPLGWHVQIFTNLAVLASLRQTIRALPVPLVADHFCRARAALGTRQPHLDVLLDLVREGRVWVKLSAPQRIADTPDCSDAGAIARALIAANPERMLWGSDWPHPGARPGVPRRVDEIEAFNPVNDGRALNRLAEWVDDENTLHKILVGNPARLYGFASTQ
jgi:predicted TIM-barrel fold metal-dependent hydrolase